MVFGRKKLVALILSSVIALLLAEAALRLIFSPTFFLAPNSDAYFKAKFRVRSEEARQRGSAFANIESDPHLGWRVKRSLNLPNETANSRGLRGPQEYAYHRTTGIGRIAVLGDSFTYGLGVADNQTYAAEIQRIIDHRYEVLNFGVNGYGTDQQLLYWLTEGRKYAPDVVVLGYYVSNFHRNVNTFRTLAKPHFKLQQGELVLAGNPVPSEQDLLERGVPGGAKASRVAQACAYGWRYVSEQLRGGREADSTFNRKAALSQAIIKTLKSSCNESGALLFVVFIRHPYEQYRDTDRIEGVLRQACEAYDVPLLCLDYSLGANEQEVRGEPIYGSNGHWTAFGHQMASRRIVAFLKQREAFRDKDRNAVQLSGLSQQK